MIYARYSDDIIVITDSPKTREEAEKKIRNILRQKGLSVNEKKEIRTSPGESWSFLGIEYCDGKTDLSSVSKDKIKAKIRRKARAIKRWQIRKGLDDTKAVKAFINAMNRKFFDSDSSHELTWVRWYFPVSTPMKLFGNLINICSSGLGILQADTTIRSLMNSHMKI